MVIYDSQFGNTKQIADAIAQGMQTKALLVRDATISDVQALDLLVIGSPTQGGRPTKSIQDFINKLPEHALTNARVAGFDTRFDSANHNFGLRLLMKTIKYAAEKIAKSLAQKGGIHPVAQGFFVMDKEGPLKEGELERARVWGKSLFNAST